MLKVVIDKHIPFITGRLEPFAEVHYLAPDEITSAAVANADALIVRTRTRCDANLLEGSKVRFIATATIGYDHIDTHYCAQHNIHWCNAPGCNAQGVCDYVYTAIRYAERMLGKRYHTLGIVGVGHVGKLVAETGKQKGMEVLLCDPPRAEKEGRDKFVELSEIIRRSDIVTLHTPYTIQGEHATHYLLNDSNIPLLTSGCLLINAARGGIVDESALLTHIAQSGKSAPVPIIDCWENEPYINKELLKQTLLGTFHIAGYTRQGKINATEMCLAALQQYFSLPTLDNSETKCCTIQQNDLTLHSQTDFDIETLSNQLKAQPWQFEQLREYYPLR